MVGEETATEGSMSPINIIVILAVVALCGLRFIVFTGITAGKKEAAALMKEQVLLLVTQKSKLRLQVVRRQR